MMRRQQWQAMSQETFTKNIVNGINMDSNWEKLSDSCVPKFGAESEQVKSSYSWIICRCLHFWKFLRRLRCFRLLDLQDHLPSLDHIGNWARHFALKPWRDFQANAPQTCCREAPSDVASDLVLLLEDLAGRSSDGASPRQKCCQRTEFQSPGKANIHQTSWARGAAMWQKSEWNTSQGSAPSCQSHNYKTYHNAAMPFNFYLQYEYSKRMKSEELRRDFRLCFTRCPGGNRNGHFLILFVPYE